MAGIAKQIAMTVTTCHLKKCPALKVNATAVINKMMCTEDALVNTAADATLPTDLTN